MKRPELHLCGVILLRIYKQYLKVASSCPINL